MTDAEFARWLRNGAPGRAVLAELTYAFEVAGAPVTAQMYFADVPYATGSAETPANQAYQDRIVGTPNLSRQLDQDTLGGRASFAIGELDLANEDGGVDALLDLIIDGHELAMYVGPQAGPRSSFRRIFKATMDSLRCNESTITVVLRDGMALLDKRVSGPPVGGTGPNAGARRPLIYGRPRRVEAVLADAANLRYVVGTDLSGDATIAVHDAGVLVGKSLGIDGALLSIGSFNASSNELLITAHGLANEDVVYYFRDVAGTDPVSAPQLVVGRYYWVRNVTADTLQLSETRAGSVIDITNATYTGVLRLRRANFFPNASGADNGSIDLSHTPAGVVTVDWTWPPEPDNALYLTTIMQPFLDACGLPAAQYLGPHPSADEAQIGEDMDVPVGFVINEPTNVADVLDGLLNTIHGFWTFTRDGQFAYGRIMPDGGSYPIAADYLITDDDVVHGSVTLDRLPPRYSRFSAIYDRNWTPQQSGLAASVSVEDVAYAASPGKIASSPAESGTTYQGAPSLYHKTISEAEAVETWIRNTPTDFAAQWLTTATKRYAPHVEIINLTVAHLGFYDLDLGDVIDMNLSVLGLSGVNAQVLGIEMDLASARMTLTLTRQRPPVHPGYAVDVSWVEFEAPGA